MVPAPHIAIETCTGRLRFRPGWWGRVVAQVEVRIRPAAMSAEFEPYLRWRDAEATDELWTTVFITTQVHQEQSP